MKMWKHINGYEDLYKISRDGELYSIRRDIIMKPKIDKDGYEEYCLFKNNKRKYKRGHRLVAEAFIENKEDKSFVNHKNFKRNDNRVENLEWCTAKENSRHAYDNRKQYREMTKKHRLLANEAVRKKIKVTKDGELIGIYDSKIECAKALDLSPKTVYNRTNNLYSSLRGYKMEVLK